MATIREIVQTVLDEIQFEDLRLHDSLVQSGDPGLLQVVAVAQRVGEELATYGNPSEGWPVLSRTLNFQSVADQGKYPLPADLERVISETFWNVDRGERVRGPVSPNEAVELMVRRSDSRDEHFYMSSDDSGEQVIRLVPTPTSAADYVLVYLSVNWIRRADGTLAARIEADDDEILLTPTWLFSQGVKAHLLTRKHLPSALAEMEMYQKSRRKEFADKRGVRPVATGLGPGILGRGRHAGNTVGRVPSVSSFGENG